MRAKGIRPMLTLHHFSNPLWLEDMGGWTNKNSAKIFLAFAEKVVDYLGDIVDDYITINEPNVYCLNGLFYGIWPPEKKSLSAFVKAFSNMAAAHIFAYEMIHKKRAEMGKNREETLVGFANHLRIFEPENEKNHFHRFSARFMEYMFQTAITEAMHTGKCSRPQLLRLCTQVSVHFPFFAVRA